jgi:hypothetical protein
MEKFAKLASMGAMGVAAGIVALYLLLLAFPFHPTPTGGGPGATGGFDQIGYHLVAIAMLVPVTLLAAAHAWFGKQLKDGPRPMHTAD